jgi:hypothetical protein
MVAIITGEGIGLIRYRHSWQKQYKLNFNHG